MSYQDFVGGQPLPSELENFRVWLNQTKPKAPTSIVPVSKMDIAQRSTNPSKFQGGGTQRRTILQDKLDTAKAPARVLNQWSTHGADLPVTVYTTPGDGFCGYYNMLQSMCMIYLLDSNSGKGRDRLRSFVESVSAQAGVDVVQFACRNRKKARIDFIAGPSTTHNAQSLQLIRVFVIMLGQLGKAENNTLFLSQIDQAALSLAQVQVEKALTSKSRLSLDSSGYLSEETVNHVCMYFSMCIGFMPYDLGGARLQIFKGDDDHKKVLASVRHGAVEVSCNVSNTPLMAHSTINRDHYDYAEPEDLRIVLDKVCAAYLNVSHPLPSNSSDWFLDARTATNQTVAVTVNKIKQALKNWDGNTTGDTNLDDALSNVAVYALLYEYMGRYSGKGVDRMDAILKLFEDSSANDHFALLPSRFSTDAALKMKWTDFLERNVQPRVKAQSNLLADRLTTNSIIGESIYSNYLVLSTVSIPTIDSTNLLGSLAKFTEPFDWDSLIQPLLNEFEARELIDAQKSVEKAKAEEWRKTRLALEAARKQNAIEVEEARAKAATDVENARKAKEEAKRAYEVERQKTTTDQQEAWAEERIKNAEANEAREAAATNAAATWQAAQDAVEKTKADNWTKTQRALRHQEQNFKINLEEAKKNAALEAQIAQEKQRAVVAEYGETADKKREAADAQREAEIARFGAIENERQLKNVEHHVVESIQKAAIAQAKLEEAERLNRESQLKTAVVKFALEKKATLAVIAAEAAREATTRDKARAEQAAAEAEIELQTAQREAAVQKAIASEREKELVRQQAEAQQAEAKLLEAQAKLEAEQALAARMQRDADLAKTRAVNAYTLARKPALEKVKVDAALAEANVRMLEEQTRAAEAKAAEDAAYTARVREDAEHLQNQAKRVEAQRELEKATLESAERMRQLAEAQILLAETKQKEVEAAAALLATTRDKARVEKEAEVRRLEAETKATSSLHTMTTNHTNMVQKLSDSGVKMNDEVKDSVENARRISNGMQSASVNFGIAGSGRSKSSVLHNQPILDDNETEVQNVLVSFMVMLSQNDTYLQVAPAFYDQLRSKLTQNTNSLLQFLKAQYKIYSTSQKNVAIHANIRERTHIFTRWYIIAYKIRAEMNGVTPRVMTVGTSLDTVKRAMRQIETTVKNALLPRAYMDLITAAYVENVYMLRRRLFTASMHMDLVNAQTPHAVHLAMIETQLQPQTDIVLDDIIVVANMLDVLPFKNALDERDCNVLYGLQNGQIHSFGTETDAYKWLRTRYANTTKTAFARTMPPVGVDYVPKVRSQAQFNFILRLAQTNKTVNDIKTALSDDTPMRELPYLTQIEVNVDNARARNEAFQRVAQLYLDKNEQRVPTDVYKKLALLTYSPLDNSDLWNQVVQIVAELDVAELDRVVDANRATIVYRAPLELVRRLVTQNLTVADDTTIRDLLTKTESLDTVVFLKPLPEETKALYERDAAVIKWLLDNIRLFKDDADTIQVILTHTLAQAHDTTLRRLYHTPTDGRDKYILRQLVGVLDGEQLDIRAMLESLRLSKQVKLIIDSCGQPTKTFPGDLLEENADVYLLFQKTIDTNPQQPLQNDQLLPVFKRYLDEIESKPLTDSSQLALRRAEHIHLALRYAELLKQSSNFHVGGTIRYCSLIKELMSNLMDSNLSSTFDGIKTRHQLFLINDLIVKRRFNPKISKLLTHDVTLDELERGVDENEDAVDYAVDDGRVVTQNGAILTYLKNWMSDISNMYEFRVYTAIKVHIEWLSTLPPSNSRYDEHMNSLRDAWEALIMGSANRTLELEIARQRKTIDLEIIRTNVVEPLQIKLAGTLVTGQHTVTDLSGAFGDNAFHINLRSLEPYIIESGTPQEANRNSAILEMIRSYTRRKLDDERYTVKQLYYVFQLIDTVSGLVSNTDELTHILPCLTMDHDACEQDEYFHILYVPVWNKQQTLIREYYGGGDEMHTKMIVDWDKKLTLHANINDVEGDLETYSQHEPDDLIRQDTLVLRLIERRINMGFVDGKYMRTVQSLINKSLLDLPYPRDLACKFIFQILQPTLDKREMRRLEDAITQTKVNDLFGLHGTIMPALYSSDAIAKDVNRRLPSFIINGRTLESDPQDSKAHLLHLANAIGASEDIKHVIRSEVVDEDGAAYLRRVVRQLRDTHMSSAFYMVMYFIAQNSSNAVVRALEHQLQQSILPVQHSIVKLNVSNSDITIHLNCVAIGVEVPYPIHFTNSFTLDRNTGRLTGCAAHDLHPTQPEHAAIERVAASFTVPRITPLMDARARVHGTDAYLKHLHNKSPVDAEHVQNVEAIKARLEEDRDAIESADETDIESADETDIESADETDFESVDWSESESETELNVPNTTRQARLQSLRLNDEAHYKDTEDQVRADRVDNENKSNEYLKNIELENAKANTVGDTGDTANNTKPNIGDGGEIAGNTMEYSDESESSSIDPDENGL